MFFLWSAIFATASAEVGFFTSDVFFISIWLIEQLLRFFKPDAAIWISPQELTLSRVEAETHLV